MSHLVIQFIIVLLVPFCVQQNLVFIQQICWKCFY